MDAGSECNLLGLPNGGEVNLTLSTSLVSNNDSVGADDSRNNGLKLIVRVALLSDKSLVDTKLLVLRILLSISESSHSGTEEGRVEVDTTSKTVRSKNLGNVSSVVVENGSNKLSLRRNSEKLNLDGSHQKTSLDKVLGLVSVLLSLVDHLVGVDASRLGGANSSKEEENVLVLLGLQNETDAKSVSRDNTLNDSYIPISICPYIVMPAVWNVFRAFSQVMCSGHSATHHQSPSP